MKKVLFLFSQLHDRDVEWLTERGRKQRIAPGELLVREGEPVSMLYLVLEGMFSVAVVSPGASPIAELGCGEVVGEMSFIDSRPPSASVTAKVPSVVLAIPQSELAEKLLRDAEFAARFYRALALFLSHRLRAADASLAARQVGYQAAPADESDELDPNVLDHVHEAGGRFERLLQRVLRVD